MNAAKTSNVPSNRQTEKQTVVTDPHGHAGPRDLVVHTLDDIGSGSEDFEKLDMQKSYPL